MNIIMNLEFCDDSSDLYNICVHIYTYVLQHKTHDIEREKDLEKERVSFLSSFFDVLSDALNSLVSLPASSYTSYYSTPPVLPALF
jgi:hypothetical protein